MLGSIIKSDKFIVFAADSNDAIKAAMECDSLSYVYVDVYESVVQISVHSEKSNEYVKPKDVWNRVEHILNKYEIMFKYKKF
jgi:hypothetical protein